jgi:hypothetical protein
MKLLRLLIVAGCVGAAAPTVNADNTRFWLTSSYAGPGVPGAPTLHVQAGTTNLLHIWAQPHTENPGAGYNSTNNQFALLQNLSLNLVTTTAGVDFIDGTYKIHNPITPILNGKPRFQYVYDSNPNIPSNPPNPPPPTVMSTRSAAQVSGGSPDKIPDLQSISFSKTSFNLIGNPDGGDCHPDDPHCVVANGKPAWLIASVGFQALQPSGPANARDVFLQIGSNGMNHWNEQTSQTDVVFGAGNGPVYDARDNRNAFLPGETFDARIIVAPFLHGDYNRNGVVEQTQDPGGDFAEWKASFGRTVPVGSRMGADGDGDGKIDASDYVVWKRIAFCFQTSSCPFGAGSGAGQGGALEADTSSAALVPEPAAMTLALFCIFLVAGCRRIRTYPGVP